MSEEGEFKKRLKELSKVTDRSQTCINNFEHWIEDAKKEYHWGMPMIFLSKPLNEQEVQKAFELLTKTIVEKDQWYERWFALTAKQKSMRFGGPEK